MNEEHFSEVAEAELDLNNALLNADIGNGYEEYLAPFDRFYDENVEVASDSNPDPLVGKARVFPIVFSFLMPLHVMAEIDGLSVLPSICSTHQRQARRTTRRLVLRSYRRHRSQRMVSWSSARRWKDARVIYERHSDQRQFGEALTMIDLDFGPRGIGTKPRIHDVV